MLTSFLITSVAALTLLLLVPLLQTRWTSRHKTVYICDVCNARDCQCRKER